MLRSRPILLVAAFVFLMATAFILNGQIDANAANAWRDHPALVPPDGRSHRGDKIVAGEIKDPRVLAELSRRFRALRTGNKRINFEIRQEYFLRLMDYYVFSDDRLVGMQRPEIESIFGPADDPGIYSISAGRDLLEVHFNGSSCIQAQYIMGF